MTEESEQPNDGLTRDERFRAQTTEQFAALGRFVQSFEQLVSAFRWTIRLLFKSGVKDQPLVNILIHHSAMTAKPLFDVMRAMYAERLGQLGPELDPNEPRVIDEALSYLAQECDDLLSIRNTLVHGTWYIGWAGHDQDDFSEMQVHKLSVKRSGLKAAETPKSANELDEWTARCAAAEKLVQRIIGGFIVGDSPRVRFNIRKEGKVWLPEPPNT